MVERDEQHVRNNRFAELCSGILDAFSQWGSAKGGTVVLLHIRKSTAFFQAKDHHEASAIKFLAQICMERRAKASPEGEKRPLLLCVVSGDTAKNANLAAQATMCGGLVEAEDLDPGETRSYVNHLIRLRAQGDEAHNWESLSIHRRKASLNEAAQLVRRLSRRLSDSSKCSSPSASPHGLIKALQQF